MIIYPWISYTSQNGFLVNPTKYWIKFVFSWILLCQHTHLQQEVQQSVIELFHRSLLTTTTTTASDSDESNYNAMWHTCHFQNDQSGHWAIDWNVFDAWVTILKDSVLLTQQFFGGFLLYFNIQTKKKKSVDYKCTPKWRISKYTKLRKKKSMQVSLFKFLTPTFFLLSSRELPRVCWDFLLRH